MILNVINPNCCAINNCEFVDYQPFQYISAYTYIGWSNANYQSTLGHCSIQQYTDLKLGAKDRLTNAFCHNCLHMKYVQYPIVIINTLWNLPDILIFNINSWIDILY